MFLGVKPNTIFKLFSKKKQREKCTKSDSKKKAEENNYRRQFVSLPKPSPIIDFTNWASYETRHRFIHNDNDTALHIEIKEHLKLKTQVILNNRKKGKKRKCVCVLCHWDSSATKHFTTITQKYIYQIKIKGFISWNISKFIQGMSNDLFSVFGFSLLFFLTM